ncbi:MAG: ABC transporter permease [Planctomycetaceae bacterium]|nr:ABC transporter permease [Planctomycetaceae bacterium]
MPLWKIALRSIQHRALSSGLTAFSMSLGVALVVAVIVIHGVIADSFNRSAQGYDFIVAPKGNALDVVFSTVFYRKPPVGTVPAKYLDELQFGKYADRVDTAIPIAIGHHYNLCPVIGTTSDFFDLEYMNGRTYRFEKGGNFDRDDVYTAIVGSKAQLTASLKIGDTFRPSEVNIDSKEKSGDNDHQPFKVVGILQPTGTAVDTAIFVNIDGFECIHGVMPEQEKGDRGQGTGGRENHADHAEDDHDHAGENAHDHKPVAYSAILVKAKQRQSASTLDKKAVTESGEEIKAEELNRTRIDIGAMALPAEIDKNVDVQAVLPAKEITALLETLVGDIQLVLIMLACLVIVVAGIGMMVSIYNTMNERRQEIAVMRALGARRFTVMAIILLESMILSLAGGLLGVIIGHCMIQLLGPWISSYSGIVLYAWHFEPMELILIPGLVALSSVIGYLPAVVAYRQDVATSLKP